MDISDGKALEVLREHVLGQIWLDGRTAIPTVGDLIQAYAFVSSETTEEETKPEKDQTPRLARLRLPGRG